MKKITLEVEIEEINVMGTDSGYWEAHYRFRRNGGDWENDMYESDWGSQTAKELIKELKDGYAMECVLNHISGS